MKNSAILKRITQYFSQDVYPCRLISVCMESKKVSFEIQHKSMDLTLTFGDAISDLSLVSQLSPEDASFLGGYYGRDLKRTLDNKDAARQAKNMTFLLAEESGTYKICYQNRKGDIGYIDTQSLQEYCESPISIVSNEYVINSFGSIQACYIGIQAGIYIEKYINDLGKTKSNLLKFVSRGKSKLRVVK